MGVAYQESVSTTLIIGLGIGLMADCPWLLPALPRELSFQYEKENKLSRVEGLTKELLKGLTGV